MKLITSPVILVLFISSFLYFNVSAYDIVPYVFGGVFTAKDEFPYMAAFGWRNNETNETDYLCGGMLIASNFVLTAAHCLFLDGKLPSEVVLGGNALDIRSPERHEVKNYSIYPEYESNQAYYDIALVELAESSNTIPVCLWTKPSLYTSNVTAIGYGATTFAGSTSTKLQKVDLKVFSKKECRRYFKRQRKFRSGIRNSHLCAGDEERKKDTCQGDSGGPLLVEFSKKMFAVGITSSGQACSGFPPAVYTRISSYTGWIEGLIREQGYSVRKVCGIE